MDYDDLLVYALKLLRDNEDIRKFYQEQFQHVLVDEYQDTNKIQSDFIDTLAAYHHQVMAVGDDAQSIYSWRGANFENVLTFPQRFPGTREVRDRDELSQHAGNPRRWRITPSRRTRGSFRRTCTPSARRRNSPSPR